MKRLDAIAGLFAGAFLLAPCGTIRAQNWPTKGEVVYVSKALQGALVGTEEELSADPRAPAIPRTTFPGGGTPDPGDASGSGYRDGTEPLGTLPSVVKPPVATACRPLKVAVVADGFLRLQERWHKKRVYSLGADWKNLVHRSRADCLKAQPRKSP